MNRPRERRRRCGQSNRHANSQRPKHAGSLQALPGQRSLDVANLSDARRIAATRAELRGTVAVAIFQIVAANSCAELRCSCLSVSVTESGTLRATSLQVVLAVT
jgi:hypothetical protein